MTYKSFSAQQAIINSKYNSMMSNMQAIELNDNFGHVVYKEGQNPIFFQKPFLDFNYINGFKIQTYHETRRIFPFIFRTVGMKYEKVILCNLLPLNLQNGYKAPHGEVFSPSKEHPELLICRSEKCHADPDVIEHLVQKLTDSIPH